MKLKKERIRKEEDLETVYGEKTTEDAFLKTGSQHYNIVLLIHGFERERSQRKSDDRSRSREEKGVEILGLSLRRENM